jgi:glucose/arabinose dehydrogenase
MTNKQLPIYDVNSTAIIGGYVYRGCSMPGWHGTYFFADYSGWVRSLVWDGANGYTDLTEQDGLEVGGRIVSFGEGGDGELYIVRQDGGTVQKIVPE